MIRIDIVDMGAAVFKRDLRAMSVDIQKHAIVAFSDLKREPMPKRLRFEKLTGYRNPAIYTIQCHAKPQPQGQL